MHMKKKLLQLLMMASMAFVFVFIYSVDVFADGDSTPPQIDTAGITVEVLGKEGKTATVGDTVRITIPIEDESRITSNNMYYRKPMTDQTSGYPTNTGVIEGTNKYYYDYEITEDYEYGTWKLAYLRLEDSANNYIWYNNQVTNPSDGTDPFRVNADFSMTEFEVTGTSPDIEAPKIDLSTLNVTPAAATVGDEVKISVKVTDDKAVDEVNIWVRQPNDYVLSWQVMKYNSDTEMYEYTIPISETSINGTWEVFSLRAYDKNSNYDDKDIDPVLTFTVSGASGETNAPVIDDASITVEYPEGRTTFASGDTVITSLNITDDTKVRFVSFYYIMPKTGMKKEVVGSFNDETNKWESIIYFDNGSQTGIWKLEQIYALDIHNNEARLYNSNVSTEPGAVDLSSADLTVCRSIGRAAISIEPVTYTGQQFTPVPTVTDVQDGVEIVLINEVDYEVVTYSDNVNAGNAKIYLKGKGDYSGTTTAAFTINPRDINNVEVADLKNASYTGDEQKPVIKVEDAEILSEGTDYDVIWSSDSLVDAGTYTATLTGKNNYTGTRSVEYIIDPHDISDAVVTGLEDKVFNGKDQKPVIKTIDGKALVEGKDYEAEWSAESFINVGDYSVTITGKNNYTGKTKASFKITINEITPEVTLSQDTFTYDGNDKKPEVTVKNGDTVLIGGLDYNVEYDSDCKSAGTHNVTVTMIGHYKGTVQKSYTINKASNTLKVSKKTLKIKSKVIKKKKQTYKVSQYISIKDEGQGNIKYKLVSVSNKKFKKYFKINSKTGKLTVKKGLKKGKYKIKVQITAAGDANYNASAAKNLTVTVKVK